MRDRLRLIRRDGALRTAALGLMLFGAFSASIAIHQSLIAVEVFGLTDGAYALLLLGAVLVGVAASIAIGIAGDRGPRRRDLAVLSVAASVAGSLAVWLHPTPATFAAAHLMLLPVGVTVFGQTFALARVASAPLAAPDRDGVLAVLRALYAVPWVAVPPLWALALGRGAPLLSVYPAMAALALLHLGLVLRAWPRDPAPDPNGRPAPWGASLLEVAAGPVLLRVALIGAMHLGPALTGIVLGLVFAEAGRPAWQVGLFFGAFVAVEVAVTLALGRMGRRMARLGIMGLGVATYATFQALLPMLAASPWVWALVVPAGAGGAMIFTLAIAYLQELLAGRPGAGSSLLAVQQLASNGLVTAVYGVGAWAGGYAAVGALGAALSLPALVRLDRR